MSHFSVLVIGENPEKQLQPYHEYECTGNNDEYVIDVDETERHREDYLEGSTTMIKSPDGNLHEAYSDKFYREPTQEEKKIVGMGSGCGKGISWNSKDWGDGKGYRAKVRYTPENCQEVDTPYKELYSFEEYLIEYCDLNKYVSGSPLTEDHKYGYVEVKDGEVLKVIDRTNPNRKWDWYLLGGRWTGYFKSKSPNAGSIGEPGLMTPQAKSGYIDQGIKSMIDFDGMRKEAREKAELKYAKVSKILGGEIKQPKRSWEDLINDKSIESFDTKRELYNNQPEVKAFKNEEIQDLVGFFTNVSEFDCSLEEYGQKASDGAISSFAVVKDGKWYEKGEMGWWGAVSDEKDQQKWNEEFLKLIDSVDDNTLLSVYDCHI